MKYILVYRIMFMYVKIRGHYKRISLLIYVYKKEVITMLLPLSYLLNPIFH